MKRQTPGFWATLGLIAVLGLFGSGGLDLSVRLALDPTSPSAWWLTLWSYGLVHSSMLHLMVNIFYIAQIAPFSWAAGGGGWRGIAAIWLLFFLGTIVGGLAHLGAVQGQYSLLFGASAGASAMAGLYVVYVGAVTAPERKSAVVGRAVIEFLVGCIGLPIAIGAFFGFQISWQAHGAGFVAGLLIASMLVGRRTEETDRHLRALVN